MKSQIDRNIERMEEVLRSPMWSNAGYLTKPQSRIMAEVLMALLVEVAHIRQELTYVSKQTENWEPIK